MPDLGQDRERGEQAHPEHRVAAQQQRRAGTAGVVRQEQGAVGRRDHRRHHRHQPAAERGVLRRPRGRSIIRYGIQTAVTRPIAVPTPHEHASWRRPPRAAEHRGAEQHGPGADGHDRHRDRARRTGPSPGRCAWRRRRPGAGPSGRPTPRQSTTSSTDGEAPDRRSRTPAAPGTATGRLAAAPPTMPVPMTVENQFGPRFANTAPGRSRSRERRRRRRGEATFGAATFGRACREERGVVPVRVRHADQPSSAI